MLRRSGCKILLLIGSLIAFGNTLADNSFNANQQAEIGNIVREYLMKNPQVIVEAYQSLENQARTQAQQQAKKAIAANTKGLLQAKSPMVGNPKGTINIIEFYDYQCNYCRAMTSIINKLQQDNANIRVIYKQLPIFGANSELAARAILAANAQGKFMPMHNALFTASKSLNKDLVMELAKSAGLNMKKFEEDMQAPATTAELANNFNLANAIGITGVPYYIITKTAQPTDDNIAILQGQTSRDNFQTIINKMGQ